jgi:hypothetical protein
LRHDTSTRRGKAALSNFARLHFIRISNGHPPSMRASPSSLDCASRTKTAAFATFSGVPHAPIGPSSAVDWLQLIRFPVYFVPLLNVLLWKRRDTNRNVRSGIQKFMNRLEH